ncbi:GntR family transcriptional regulator [Berryella wangjianweii]|uniref:GntR family transcriptional regulator n=1 Tax=Berryella wangjianweii TaxID=2734634 RepID=A0A6M8J322_9ACTN|nr:GntR family transcriptional regulator [Berryella wangjianweii]NPD31873.1 GntR family transcriptional regulator [Eggerthellaceae bacterium zg-997]QKF07531.1 GntR family transcriptional regulator [Berryella wangjianweii]
MSQFKLDENSSVPLWVQLKNRLIYLITSGAYRTGDKLPTVRGLAAEANLNYNTVSKVYQSLEADGYIQSVRRQGAFVCDVSDKPGVSSELLIESITRDYVRRCMELGWDAPSIRQLLATVINQMGADPREGEGDADSNAEEAEAASGIIGFDRIRKERRASR